MSVSRKAVFLMLLPVFLLSSIACEPASQDEAPMTDDSHPLWLTGGGAGRSVPSSDGASRSEGFQFKADGSGIETFSSYEANPLPYGGATIGGTSSTSFTWAFHGDSISIGPDRFSFAVSPGCRFIQIDGVTYSFGNSPRSSCPTTSAPITEDEKKFVGVWAERGNGLFLDIDEDRTMGVSEAGLALYEFAFVIDPDGTIHGRNPDGGDGWAAKLTLLDADDLRLCRGSSCKALRRSTP